MICFVVVVVVVVLLLLLLLMMIFDGILKNDVSDWPVPGILRYSGWLRKRRGLWNRYSKTT